MQVYVHEQGAVIRKKGGLLQITHGKDTIKELPLMKVEQIVLMGNGQLTTQAAKYMLDENSEVAADLGCEISTSSLDERLRGRVVMLLHEVLPRSIRRQVDVSRLSVSRLQQFSRMVLYDSTTISLPPIFNYTLGGGQPSGRGQMKVQEGNDYLNAQ